MFIRDLFAVLSARRVPYCVVGGVAVNLHGVPRMTYDVDLAVPTTIAALTDVHVLLGELGLQCRLPIHLPDLADDTLRASYRDDRNLIAVTYTDPTDPLREVDILVSPPIAASELVARAITLKLDDLPVSVVALQDLIALKRASGRPQDLADVEHLARIAKERPDG